MIKEMYKQTLARVTQLELLTNERNRKFNLVVWMLVTATLMRVLNYIEAAHWVDMVKWLITVYVAANVGQKFIARNNNNKERKDE